MRFGTYLPTKDMAGLSAPPCWVSGRFAAGEFVVPMARRNAGERRKGDYPRLPRLRTS